MWRYVTAFILAGAAIPKFLDLRNFRRVVGTYELVPAKAVAFVAAAVPVIEAACAIALIAGIGVAAAASAAAALFACFAVAVAANLLRGRRVECGCGGLTGAQRVSWRLAGGDLSLSVLASGVAVFAPRTLTTVPLNVADRRLDVTAGDELALIVVAMAIVLVWACAAAWNAVARVSHGVSQ